MILQEVKNFNDNQNPQKERQRDCTGFYQMKQLESKELSLVTFRGCLGLFNTWAGLNWILD